MSEQQEAKQVVENIEALIRKFLPTGAGLKFLAPVELQIISFNGQRGTATLREDSKIVDFQTHPLQTLSAGDAAVGVPLTTTSYYIVGRIA